MKVSKSVLQKLYDVGHIAKGVVYGLIGAFAIATVIGAANSPNGPREVIDFIGEHAFGTLLLILIGFGFLAYAAWQWIRAAADTDEAGSDKSGAVKRTGWAVSGLAYGLLAVYAFSSIEGNASGGTKRDMLGELLQESWGGVVVIIISLILFGVGVYQFYKGVSKKFMDDLHHISWSEGERELYEKSGIVGHIARAVVYGLIGFFLLQVGLSENPEQFRGIGGALTFLEDQTFGAALLAIMGVGMLAYGFFMFVQAKYRQV